MDLNLLNAAVMAFILSGAIILTISLYYGYKTYKQAREHFQTWWLLIALNGLFIGGYGVLAWSMKDQTATLTDLVVALILFGGSILIWGFIQFGQSLITELTRIAALERHRAIHDDLTSLPNRAFFTGYLDDALRHRKPARPKQLAVLMMDMDRFKIINDTMGHYYGDILLQQIALRLHRAIRRTDMLARLGGDEFGVMLELADDPSPLNKICQHIVEALKEPFAVNGFPAEIGVSIGVAWCPDHGQSSIELMKHAKTAMYEAKKRHINTVVYEPQLDTRDLDRLNVLNELRRAIEYGELVVHYQPQYDLKSGLMCGAEALIRWPHPRFGLLLPDEFIPLAEQHGLINRLSHWVLDIVLEQLRAWQDEGIDMLLSTNISATDLQEKQFFDYVDQGIRSRGLSSAKLKLEITESAVIAQHEQAFAIIKRLQKLGLQISIDDFGTGYSSLQYLRKLPIDEIKIDKSFVMNMTKDYNDAMIIQSTIDLGHKLGRHVTAEGVDSPDSLELLKKWGCDRVQGFYLSQPLSIDELNLKLRSNNPASLSLPPLN